MVLGGENSWRGREEYLRECQNNRECLYYINRAKEVARTMSASDQFMYLMRKFGKKSYRYFHCEGAKEIQSDYRK